MAITNFMITVGKPNTILLCAKLSVVEQITIRRHAAFAAGIAAVAYLMRGDVRTGATTFRRNLRHIRGWLEEQNAASSQ